MLIGKQTAHGDGNSLGDGLATKVQDGSIMAYFADNTQQITPEQMRFLQKLPKDTVDALSQAAKAGKQTAVQAADAAAKTLGEQMAGDMIVAMNKTVSIAYSANNTASGKRVVSLSPTQKQQINLLAAQADARTNAAGRAQAQQNLTTLVRGAVLLTGNNSGLRQ